MTIIQESNHNDASRYKKLDILLANIPGLNPTVLEIGASSGNVTNILLEQKYHVTAIEPSPAARSVIKRDDSLVLLESLDGLVWAKFDIIICTAVLCHSENGHLFPLSEDKYQAGIELLDHISYYMKPTSHLICWFYDPSLNPSLHGFTKILDNIYDWPNPFNNEGVVFTL